MSEKKGTAEQLFSDMLQTLKERQGDLDKAIAKYQGDQLNLPWML
ncbi:hypothetical protein [Methanobacterium petrolearium]|nr:hypothetical protein GCM10025861_19140 [Methanobacterium petrolearium]